MSNDLEREVEFLKKRIELLEEYQRETLRLVLDGEKNSPAQRVVSKVSQGNIGASIRRLLLQKFSIVDSYLVRYRRYNQLRRWIYKK